MLLESVTRVVFCGTQHQLALNDLRKAAGKRDGGDERVRLRKWNDPCIELMCTFQTIGNV
jgi:hypothetical protein